MATRILLADLERLPPVRWCVLDFAVLREDPGPRSSGSASSPGVAPPETVSPAADPGDAARPTRDARGDRAGARNDRGAGGPGTRVDRAAARRRASAGGPADPTSPTTSPLRSVNSSNLAEILNQLGSSLMVTTYQTGKLVAVRRDGDGVNTHFRQFESPMGLDRRGGRLAIGTRSQIFEYHNVPSLLEKMQPPRQARRLLRAAALPLHRRRPHPRRGLRRQRALVRRDPLLVPRRRSTTSTASSRAGAPRSSPRSPPRTAATSTASA